MKKSIISFLSIYLTMLLCTSGAAIIVGLNSFQIIRIDILLTICFICLLFYIKYRCMEIINHTRKIVTLCLLILLSSILLLCLRNITYVPIWLLGIILIAKQIDTGVALLFLYTSFILQMLTSGLNFIDMFIPLIVGTILCILSSYIHSFINAIFVFLISFAMQVVVLLTWNQFDLSKILNTQSIVYVVVMSSMSILLFFIDSFISVISSSIRDVNKSYFSTTLEEDEEQTDNLISLSHEIKLQKKKLFEQYNQVKEEYDDLYKSLDEIKAEKTNVIKDKEQAQTEYDLLVQEIDKLRTTNTQIKQEITNYEEQAQSIREEIELKQKQIEEQRIAFEKASTNARKDKSVSDNILLNRLKVEYPKLYNHSLRVSLIASKAASLINADRILTYTSGIYHEINKLLNNKSMEDIEDYLSEILPANVVKIIVESNNRNHQPKLKEACLIALTDDIITTMNYLKNNSNNNIPFDKIVENVFKLRQNKGMFSNANINESEINMLKEYFIKWNGGTN